MPSVLIVSHCFPPDFSVGAKRALRMASILSRFGWTVKVVTARESYFEGLDRTLSVDPAPYEVIRTHAIAPKQWARWIWQSARGNRFESGAEGERVSNGHHGSGG